MEVFDFYNGETKPFGIIGNPIGHSFSPVLQNTVLKELGSNGVYVPFRVEDSELKKAVEGLYALGFEGINVTVPHKKSVMQYLCGIDETAELVGAVNTLKRTENGFKGYNTDILGLKKSFELNNINVKGKRALLLGAGGAANSAAVLLAKLGASEIIFVNRTLDKAEALKKHVDKFYSGKTSVMGFGDIYDSGKPDIVVNATSVGMGEGVWESPVAKPELFEGIAAVFDIVYIPWKTKLLSDAEKYGCKCVNGFDMLIYQGLASYEIWHETEIEDLKAIEIRDTLSEYFLKRR
ncbi:shikimate dehydrogenase [Lachnospiraceae bacterium NSJ-143]|nr:shikimate dehydrogenase [Lachnospiraceae bacterium NSJ-143]